MFCRHWLKCMLHFGWFWTPTCASWPRELRFLIYWRWSVHCIPRFHMLAGVACPRLRHCFVESLHSPDAETQQCALALHRGQPTLGFHWVCHWCYPAQNSCWLCSPSWGTHIYTPPCSAGRVTYPCVYVHVQQLLYVSQCWLLCASHVLHRSYTGNSTHSNGCLQFCNTLLH